MFICSIKASKIKLFGAFLLSAAALLISLSLVPVSRDDTYVGAISDKSIRFDGIESEEQLYSFIEGLGISVKTPAWNSIDVDIPRVFDAVYKKYNDIQRQMGLDLSKYKGKTLHRYTFEVTNYPTGEGSGEGKVYLTLFTYKDRVVAGDISSRDYGGFVRTFTDFANPDLSES